MGKDRDSVKEAYSFSQGVSLSQVVGLPVPDAAQG